jgi:CheY-like chemotaxis protein
VSDRDRKKAKILVIDDNGVSRAVLRATLRSDGYQNILEASKSSAGLAMAHEHH